MEIAEAAAAGIRTGHDVVIESAAACERRIGQIDVGQIDRGRRRILNLHELACSRCDYYFREQQIGCRHARCACRIRTDGNRRRGSRVARLTIQCVWAAEGPVSDRECVAVGAGPIVAVRPAILVLPRLSATVNINVPKHVDDAACLEQFDRIVAVDFSRTASVVRRETKECRKARCLRRYIQVRAGACRAGWKDEFFAVTTATIVGRANTECAQVRNIIEDTQFDGLWHPAGERSINDSRNDHVLGESPGCACNKQNYENRKNG